MIVSIIGPLVNLVTQWWVWLPIAATLGYLTWQNRRKAYNAASAEHVLLLLEIPRANDKKELAAEQMFAALHGILRPKAELMREGILQEHVSFEIAAIDQRIRFYVWTPKHLQNFVEGQVYAQYPTVQIKQLDEDYAARQIDQPIAQSVELTLTDNEVLPIKTFQNFEVDPLAAITATLAKLEAPNEEMWIQILARPLDDSWHKRGSKFIDQIKNGRGWFTGGGVDSFFSFMGQLFEALWKPPEPGKEGEAAKEVGERDKSRITAIEEKTKKLGYQVKIRLMYLGDDKTTARLRLQAMIGTFKQFNTTNLNGFSQKPGGAGDNALAEYRARFFLDEGKILNIEELASLYHLPHTNVETPNIVWATSKTAEPPSTLPSVGTVPEDQLSPFAVTNFRGNNIQFGLKRSDRGRHVYVVGQTGTGKSFMLQLLSLSDIYHSYGFGVIDPHGDYAVDVLRFIPKDRIKDVVYFNPADREFPIGFNPLEVIDPNLKNHISSELVGVLKRMFESWGPRLEYILRYTILALLDYPNSTMLDITRMLTERNFRDEVIRNIQDPVVRNFWINEFGSWNDKFASEAVAPVLNKVGAFTANPLIRNIIGQPKSTFNLREVMDKGQILLVNLSRGLIGEDNAAILGAMIVTKIQLAAMSRADIPRIEDRRPFYLYVDEFQNFATDSFAVILSEARKYGLNLTVANQYVSQMSPEVKDAIFGNVGSIISFRVGADDAHALQRYVEPQFEAQDLIQLHNQHIVAALSIDGEKTPAFSATTLKLPTFESEYIEDIIGLSRERYGRPKAEVEAAIIKATGDTFSPRPLPTSSDSKRPSTPRTAGSVSYKKKHNSNTKYSPKTQPSQLDKPVQDDGHLAEDTIIKLR
ncbi:MAG TPA: DUF87 domain-containing protein [Candidatus Saccharimonadales bacterium]